PLLSSLCRIMLRISLVTDSLIFVFIFFFFLSVHHRDLHSFPTRRSSDLTRRASSTRLKCCPFRPWMTSCGLHCIAGFTASIPHCSGMPHGHLRRSTSS